MPTPPNRERDELCKTCGGSGMITIREHGKPNRTVMCQACNTPPKDGTEGGKVERCYDCSKPYCTYRHHESGICTMSPTLCHGHKPSDPAGWEERLSELLSEPYDGRDIKSFIAAELKSNAEAVVARFEGLAGCGREGIDARLDKQVCGDGKDRVGVVYYCEQCQRILSLCREIREAKG